ncbi:MAG: phosphoesterase [Gammaproteobacteria bacterium]|nr:MAG: phosphoesterase [Gammaproteobacteria bacterium]
MPLLLFYCIVKLDWIAQWALFALLVVELLFACLCFLLLPVQMEYLPGDSSGFWQPLFNFSTTLSMANNHFPSLHVAFACTAGLALRQVVCRWQLLLIILWIVLIAISTVMIHEHHLLDVLAGGLLAIGAETIIRHRVVKDNILQRVRLEWLWWYNQALFTRRHHRYGLITIMLTIQRLFHPNRGNLLVSGYCFLQAFDDIMDGDRISLQSPLHISQTLITAWQRGQFTRDNDLICLAADFCQRLSKRPNSETAIADVIALLQVMQSDYLRAGQREIWTAEMIRQQHQKTFSLSLDLLLFALSSQVRVKDVPELVMLLGWCSTMRDLGEDLQKGIINIPAEVLPSPPLSSPGEIDKLLHQPATIQWLQQQHQQALSLSNELNDRMSDIQLDKTGERIIRIFLRSTQQFAKQRFTKLYPQVQRKALNLGQ